MHHFPEDAFAAYTLILYIILWLTDTYTPIKTIQKCSMDRQKHICFCPMTVFVHFNSFHCLNHFCALLLRSLKAITASLIYHKWGKNVCFLFFNST